MIHVKFVAKQEAPVNGALPAPYWRRGYRGENLLMEAYVRDLKHLLQCWPSAVHIEPLEVEDFDFTVLRPRPATFTKEMEHAFRAG